VASILHGARAGADPDDVDVISGRIRTTWTLRRHWRTGAAHALRYLNLVPQGLSTNCYGRLAAALELISRALPHLYPPAYGIDKVLVGNQELAVTEEVTYATPFGSLLHFKKENSPEQPRLFAGGADVRPLRDTVARHRADPAAGSRRLHHRLHNPATFRSITANSASTNIPSTSSPFSINWVPARIWSAICQRRCRRSPPPRSCRRTITRASCDADPDGWPDRHAHSSPPRSTNSPRASRSNGSRIILINYVPIQCKGAFRQVYPASCSSPPFVSMNLERHIKQHIDLATI